MQWHQLDDMQTICTSLQADNHTSTSSLNFYRLDALPDAQPAVRTSSDDSVIRYVLPVVCMTSYFTQWAISKVK